MWQKFLIFHCYFNQPLKSSISSFNWSAMIGWKSCTICTDLPADCRMLVSSFEVFCINRTCKKEIFSLLRTWKLLDWPPIYLHLIFDIFKFEISSLMNWIFFQVWTGFLQATQAVKIKFKLGKNISSSNWKFQTGEFEKSSSDR